MLATWEKQKPQSTPARDPDLARILSIAACLSVESGLGRGCESHHARLSPNAGNVVSF